MTKVSGTVSAQGVLIDDTAFISPYLSTLKIQRILNDRRNRGETGDVIMLLQHPPTYTTGIHDNPPEYPYLDEKPVRLERGGSVTYHGPGQLVMYFIINLRDSGINVLQLIEKIQSSMSDALKNYGILSEGRLGKETGLWLWNGKKIASIGLAVKGFSTLHGAAVNISNDMSPFSKIRPCGFDHDIMTSLSLEKGREVDFSEFVEIQKNILLEKFQIGETKKFHEEGDLMKYLNVQLSETAPS